MVIFPLILQTIIITQILSTGWDGCEQAFGDLSHLRQPSDL